MALLMWVEMITFESSLWEAGPEASLSSYPILPVCVWHFYVTYSLHTFLRLICSQHCLLGFFWLSTSLYTSQDVQFFAVPYTCSCLGTFFNTYMPPMYYTTYFSLVGHIDHMLTEKCLCIVSGILSQYYKMLACVHCWQYFSMLIFEF